MGFFESINRAFFNLTYNEQASKAYDEQNTKAATAVDDIKKQIQGYRDARDRLLAANEATSYFSTNSLASITEWENWLQKNGGLAAGDYTKKSTEMKTQWESIFNSNTIVQEMERIPEFLELFLKDKESVLPAAQKKEIEALKKDADTYLSKLNNKTPAELVAKRDEFNGTFTGIQKKIPENFTDLKEGFESDPQVTLLQGIDSSFFNDYKNRVLQKEQADEDTFKPSRILTRTGEYFGAAFSATWGYFIGIIFAIIVANDAIGRPAMYRFFYFVYTILLCQSFIIPGVIPVVLFLYYLVRSVSAINFEHFFSFDPKGPRMNFLQAPVLFNVLPLFPASPSQKLPWWLTLVMYNPEMYGGLAEKKRLAFEMDAATVVGKKVELDAATLEQILCNLKSAVLGIEKDKFTAVLTSLKGLVT
jgi:hypothetical protein